MPDTRPKIPVAHAVVKDLRWGCTVKATCPKCGHSAEISASKIRTTLPEQLPVRHIGRHFRCAECGQRGVRIDAEGATDFA